MIRHDLFFLYNFHCISLTISTILYVLLLNNNFQVSQLTVNGFLICRMKKIFPKTPVYLKHKLQETFKIKSHKTCTIQVMKVL